MTLYAETVSLFSALGEVDRKATFAPRQLLAGCKYEETEGAVRRAGYDISTTKAVLYVPVPLAATLMDGTLAIIKVNDRIVRGSVREADDDYTRRVIAVAPLYLQGRLHHIEVACA